MNTTSEEIELFLRNLTNLPSLPNTENLYSSDQYESKVRLSNLRIYLNEMIHLSPTCILIGEAPGYKGCKLTGIPFTSEKIMLNSISSNRIFGKGKGYQILGNSAPCGEQSATIVWNALSTMRNIPLLWNAFPFHPYQVGNICSNRKPTSTELKIGSNVMKQLINIFSIEEIVAVGNSAYESLQSLNISCVKIRHPANGGKSQFTQQAIEAFQ